MANNSEKVHRYPAKMSDSQPYVLISRHRAQYNGEATAGSNFTGRTIEGLQGTATGIVKEELDMVAMYMPMGISIADSMQFENVSTGFLGGLIGGSAGMNAVTMDDIKNAIASPDNAMQAADSILTRLENDFMAGGDTASIAASGVGAAAAGGIAGGLLGKIGIGAAAVGIGFNTVINEAQKSIQSSLNPREFLLFKAPSMRSFSLQFRFVPESADEANTVDKIITWFREGMYPDITGLGFGYKFPDAFAITFENTNGIPALPEVYLESANLTYNPNSMSFYKSANGGRPIEVTLSLSFKEIQPLNRQLVKMGF